MKVLHGTALILVLFFVFVGLLFVALDKWIEKPTPSFSFYPGKDWAEVSRKTRATNLVKARYWPTIKTHMEGLEGYIELHGWEAQKISSLFDPFKYGVSEEDSLQKPGLFKDYYAEEVLGQVLWKESTYIVSYTYATPVNIEEGLVQGWWWEVILGQSIVRSLDIDAWEKGKSFVDYVRYSLETASKYDFLTDDRDTSGVDLKAWEKANRIAKAWRKMLKAEPHTFWGAKTYDEALLVMPLLTAEEKQQYLKQAEVFFFGIR